MGIAEYHTDYINVKSELGLKGSQACLLAASRLLGLFFGRKGARKPDSNFEGEREWNPRSLGGVRATRALGTDR